LDFTPVSFSIDGVSIVAEDDIDEQTLNRLRDVTRANPGAKILVFNNIGGSVDDDANLIFIQAVRNAGFKTIVPSNGLVASGGTDLFLAGVERILEPGACVHT
jgi:hypothetical protein